MSGIIHRIREQLKAVSVGSKQTVVCDAGTALCTTCAALDFKKILREGLPDANMAPLGTFLEITQKSDQCAFCRLVADLIRRRWRLDDFPHADIEGTICSVSARGSFDDGPGEKKDVYRLYIHASPRPFDVSGALIAAKAFLYLDIQLLEDDAHKLARSKYLYGRRIKVEVDFHMIKKWIKLCEQAHGEACRTVWWKSGNEDLPDFVRMVDVTRMSLVHAGRGSRYVALSYVWGGPGDDYWTTTANAKLRNRPSGLEESLLPATIVDAIQITRQIGERYLWIDALCIIQDSQEDKAAQISIMDRIYGRAALTIIAASGESVRAGLPGVGTSRILHQHIECVQGLHLSIPLAPLAEVVVDSTWGTRAWTFQEMVLSQRRLYFTKHQIYFECAEDVWCEDLVAESKKRQVKPASMRLWSTDHFPITLYPTMEMNFRGYEGSVEEYTRRRLTVESDIIDAITALTNAITRVLEPAGSNSKEAFRFGMWIRYLDLSLLWQPRLNAGHTRRTMTDARHSHWPSWAWSGWKGAVHYPIESHLLDGTDVDVHPLPAESLVTAWNVVDEDGTIVRLDVKQIPPSWNVDKNTDEPPPKHYTPCNGQPSDVVLDFLPPKGTLIFRTQCARFQISAKLDDGDLAEPSQATAHTIFHIVPVDQASPRYAGRIVLPVTTPSQTIFEFVVLSRCDGLRGLWDETVWGKRYYGCLLHVMAVQRMRDDARVYQRVGVGLIVESAWMGSRAEERVVLLA